MKRSLFGILLLAAVSAQAAIKTETVTYKHGGALLEGYLVYDDSIQGKRPGVLVVHEWMGLDASAKKHAEDVAKLGYVAFAADIYGKGQMPTDVAGAGKLSGFYKSDRALLRGRVNAGLKALRGRSNVDGSKIAAIGYCFGGTSVLELARSGVNIDGVVSFHGGLSSPTPADAKKIKARVLVLHGADDPHVSPKEVADFEEEMRNGKVDWQLVSYGGAVHGFTNSGAGRDNSKGYAYNEKADKRSWQAMQTFFDELFGTKR